MNLADFELPYLKPNFERKFSTCFKHYLNVRQTAVIMKKNIL